MLLKSKPITAGLLKKGNMTEIYLCIRRLRASLLGWVFPLLLLSYFGFDNYIFLVLAVISLAAWFTLGWLDTAIFRLFAKPNNLDMVKIIHRRRHQMLIDGQVGAPRVDKSEEKSGYGL